MESSHGFKAKYDYVELNVERRADRWRLGLTDRRHAEHIEDEEEYATADEAKEAALALAQRHINIQHNDTLLARDVLSWHEY